MFATILGCTTSPAYLPVDTGDAEHSDQVQMTWQEGPIVVIGGGPSGMAAAMDLEDVILFEASGELGGRAPGAGQLMTFVGTEEQEAFGVEDSVELALEDWPFITGSEPTQATEDFLRASDEVHDRLVDMGLSFKLSGPDHPLRRQRNHGAESPGLPLTLEQGLPSHLDLRLNTPVTGLIIEQGRVLGVTTDEGEVLASAVIIASGGFAGRVDLLEGHLDWEGGSWRPAADSGATGDALDWAFEHDLAVADLDHMGALVEAVGLPGSDGLAVDIYGSGPHDWLLVNEEGRRFVDESQTFSLFIAGAVQQNAPAWMLIGEDKLRARLPEGEEELLERVDCTEDAEELADLVGVDPKGLGETFEQLREHETSLVQGTLCAVPPGFVASKGFGGLDVDERHRVMDLEGQPIEGLYAVGEAAGMGAPGMGGEFGFDGSLSAVVWSGWRAAESIRDAREQAAE